METINTRETKIEEITLKEEGKKHAEENTSSASSSPAKGIIQDDNEDKMGRPHTVEAKVYKLKSRYVKENLYITLSYVVDHEGRNRPVEIFINSKDLSRLPEYTVLTRLISAIFRHFRDPRFILDELQSIYDPTGGYFYKGKYIYSFYSEIALIVEKFFIDIGFMQKNTKLDNWIENAKNLNPDKKVEMSQFKICPECNQRSLQVDGGCLQCINPECGYSKCN